ncbi:MCE family protein [Nocardioides sp. NPDC101246]|uniref:MCE family protein n=1 Tax=Nocardioides sp. NPDC101246 TaxID=3364336 RepID=UPI00381DEC0D
MNRTRTEQDFVRFAAIGTLAVALVFVGVLTWKRLPLVSGDTTTYTAEFADASGLVAGEDVRVAGVKVGTISDIRLGRGKVLVDIEVDGLEVGEQSTARIEIKTLLGQHYVSLQSDGEPLRDGGVIPLAHTSTPVDIVPTLDELGAKTAELDSAKMAEAFAALATVLDRSAPQLEPTLRSLTDISEAISSRDAKIRELFENTKTVSGVVAARDQDLKELLASSVQVLQMLEDRREVLDQLISGTKLLATQVRAVISENEALIEPTLAKLDAVLKVLRANREQIDAILENSLAYARSFMGVAGTGRWLDATVGLPQGAAVCLQPTTGDLGDLVGGLLSEANKALNDSDQPCLPAGPAVTR